MRHIMALVVLIPLWWLVAYSDPEPPAYVLEGPFPSKVACEGWMNTHRVGDAWRALGCFEFHLTLPEASL